MQALSVERLSILEQAAPLADEFARTCDDLDAWLSNIEVELENCPAVVAGMPVEQVRVQKDHNKVSKGSFSKHFLCGNWFALFSTACQ